jgi:hypothetical protein
MIFSISSCRPAYASASSTSIFRIFFQVPYPLSPLLATLTKTAGVCTNNSHSGTHHIPSPTGSPFCNPFVFMVFPEMGDVHTPYSALASSLSLLTRRVFHNSFAIMDFRTLLRFCKAQLLCFHTIPHSLRKNTRVGVPLDLQRESPSSRTCASFPHACPYTR